MDERTTLFLEVMAGFAIIIALAIIGWTTRRRRQRHIPAPRTLPADIGEVRFECEGLYVSTTLDGQPLNRVAVRGLGFRARASIAVADRGVVLALPGNSIFIPRDDIREVTRAQYTIDRVVEPGGLALIAWILRDPEAAGGQTPADVGLVHNSTDSHHTSSSSNGSNSSNSSNTRNSNTTGNTRNTSTINVDTYLRVDETQQLVDAIASILHVTSGEQIQ